MTGEPDPGAQPAAGTGPRPVAAIPRGLIVLLGTAAAVITGAGIQALAWLVGPVFLALTIVIAVSPVQDWMRRRGLPQWAATVVLMIVVYGLLVALFAVVFLSVAQLVSILPQYSQQANDLVDKAVGVMNSFGVGPDQVQQAASSVDLSKLSGVLQEVLGGLGNLVTNIIFLLALLFFLSVEASFVNSRLSIIAEDHPATAVALGDFAKGTRRYLVVSTVFGLVVAVLDTIGLAIVGIPLPVLWGLLAFITNYIPNVGFVLGLIPPALLGLLDGGWPEMLAVIIIYGGLNFVIQSLIQPRFVGDAVGLSATVTFLSLLFWTWMVGAVGAILAIPFTLLAKALLIDIDPRARWADALLGARERPRGKRKQRRADKRAQRRRAAATDSATGTRQTDLRTATDEA